MVANTVAIASRTTGCESTRAIRRWTARWLKIWTNPSPNPADGILFAARTGHAGREHLPDDPARVVAGHQGNELGKVDAGLVISLVRDDPDHPKRHPEAVADLGSRRPFHLHAHQ